MHQTCIKHASNIHLTCNPHSLHNASNIQNQSNNHPSHTSCKQHTSKKHPSIICEKPITTIDTIITDQPHIEQSHNQQHPSHNEYSHQAFKSVSHLKRYLPPSFQQSVNYTSSWNQTHNQIHFQDTHDQIQTSRIDGCTITAATIDPAAL